MIEQSTTGTTKSFYIPLDLLARVQHAAMVENRSDSNMICRLLEEALAAHERAYPEPDGSSPAPSCN